MLPGMGLCYTVRWKEVTMTYSLKLELPDELRRSLTEVATLSGQTPEEWVVAVVRQQLGRRDENLRRHFGALDLGAPVGADNEQIDADLARVYSDDHGAA
jgi:hypothetical protein